MSFVISEVSHGEGHGPAFGLATPTLARGQWSSDTAVVQTDSQAGDALSYREMVGYGITEDLQVLLTFPLREPDNAALTRGGSMMGAMDTIEGSLQWRFHRTAPEVGVRRESALLVGIAEPTDDTRGMMQIGTSVHAAAVTGYVSRTMYWWAGAGTQYYLEKSGDRPGALYYVSGVLGYRPPLFQHDYPKPDWRVFLEGLAEAMERHSVDGRPMRDSGGEKLLIGPSVLGLYGRWGIEAGVLWPVVQSLNGVQAEEHYRAKLVLTYWF
jgi:hypothetical protein